MKKTCAVCGDDGGNFKQWWNRDTGYGVCRGCVDDAIKRGESPEEIKDLYGVEGIHYAAKEQP